MRAHCIRLDSSAGLPVKSVGEDRGLLNADASNRSKPEKAEVTREKKEFLSFALKEEDRMSCCHCRRYNPREMRKSSVTETRGKTIINYETVTASVLGINYKCNV